MSEERADSPNYFKRGTLIAKRYEVVERVGGGSVGEVYRVSDRALDNATIALKILHRHLSKNKLVFARFRNEVLIARQLAHPNIVRIFDFGKDTNGECFLSMEFIRGQNLSSMIHERRKQRLSFPQTLLCLYQISKALAYAHQQRVIHRDLKPDNILVLPSGKVKITDFGLARSLVLNQNFAAAGEAVGTPYYMSPEQVRGEDCDQRADIYALGIVAYELITGRRPFHADTWFQLATLHCNQALPEFAEEHRIPLWYEDFTRKCTAKNPAQRFTSMDEVVRLLGHELKAQRARSKWKRLISTSIIRRRLGRGGLPLALRHRRALIRTAQIALLLGISIGIGLLFQSPKPNAIATTSDLGNP